MPVEKNDWGRLADRAQQRASAAVRYAAANASTHAAMRSRFKDGNMRDGWQITNEKAGLKATVYNSMNYAIHHEFGFMAGWPNRPKVKVSAQPMIRPALDAVAGTFQQMLQQVIDPRLA